MTNIFFSIHVPIPTRVLMGHAAATVYTMSRKEITKEIGHMKQSPCAKSEGISSYTNIHSIKSTTVYMKHFST